MDFLRVLSCTVTACLGVVLPVRAQTKAKQRVASPPRAPQQGCPRFAPGSTLTEPVDLRSANGVLRVALKFRNSRDENGLMRYCYISSDGSQSPNLRLHPGDTLVLSITNEVVLPAAGNASAHKHKMNSAHGDAAAKATTGEKGYDPCSGGPMVAGSTNVHFHGMLVPPVCHQDESVKTQIRPSATPFEYRIQIPENEPPGLYWYHPHPHGFSEEQVLGGASGALIVEGIERVNKDVAGLPERILVVRDQDLPNAPATGGVVSNRPTRDLSINYVPVPYPDYPVARIPIRSGERQLWRVLNASADTFLDLALVSGKRAQSLGVVGLDGVPFGFDEGNSTDRVLSKTHILLPPAGRAEFIVTAPAESSDLRLVTLPVERGPFDEMAARRPAGAKVDSPLAALQDDEDPARPLAQLEISPGAPPLHSRIPASPSVLDHSNLPPLSAARPVRVRKFYFSEKIVDPDDRKNGTLFFLTEEGQTPARYDPQAPTPNVIVHLGDVEDWVIENRSTEPHTFHIHQTHFLVISRRGAPYEDPYLRDTINVPYWNGLQPEYPSVRLRLDFRDPHIVGTFMYHCHILQHEDGGMMGTIRVEPVPPKQDAAP